MDTEKKIDESLNLGLLKESTILFLEDDLQIQADLKLLFEKYFKQVLLATSVEQGLELCTNNKNSLDIILTGINLPKIDGVGFISQIRGILPDIPIVICTEFTDPETLIKAIKLKVADYLIKPIQHKTTIKIFNRILMELQNNKLIAKQDKELHVYKDILDKENLVSETDLKGNITYANELFCTISGYSRDELIGQPHNIIRHPDTSSKIFEQLWETIQSGNVWRGKIKNKAKDGSAYYVKSTIFPIFDENENIKKYVASRFLVTEDEEEKQILKRYILQQKSQKLKDEQEIEIKYNEIFKKANIEKEKKIASFIGDLEKEIKSLRVKMAEDKGRIISLEKKLEITTKTLDNNKTEFLDKIRKMREASSYVYENYKKFKQVNDGFVDKINKAHETVDKYQKHIDEYRTKIKNLEDVIASYEADRKKEAK